MDVISRKDAKARGLKRYFTGKPCKYGHVVERLLSTGVCIECARLNATELRKANPELARQRTREWKARNPGWSSKNSKAWRARNPERCREYNVAYRKANLELVRQRHRRWKAKHPERAAAAEKNWRLRNRDKTRANARATRDRDPERWKAWQRSYRKRHAAERLTQVLEWAKNNPRRVKANKRRWMERHPDQVRVAAKLRSARKRGAEGKYTAADIQRLFDLQQGKCAYFIYCGRFLGIRFDVDHIVPLVKGGTNWPWNLQLCCDSCNSRKNKMDHETFVARLERETKKNGSTDQYEHHNRGQRGRARRRGALAHVSSSQRRRRSRATATTNG